MIKKAFFVHSNFTHASQYIPVIIKMGGAVALWLLRSTPERVVRVRALARDTVSVVVLGKTLNSYSASPPRCINGYRQFVGETYQIVGK